MFFCIEFPNIPDKYSRSATTRSTTTKPYTFQANAIKQVRFSFMLLVNKFKYTNKFHAKDRLTSCYDSIFKLLVTHHHDNNYLSSGHPRCYYCNEIPWGKCTCFDWAQIIHLCTFTFLPSFRQSLMLLCDVVDCLYRYFISLFCSEVCALGIIWVGWMAFWVRPCFTR